MQHTLGSTSAQRSISQSDMAVYAVHLCAVCNAAVCGVLCTRTKVDLEVSLWLYFSWRGTPRVCTPPRSSKQSLLGYCFER